MASLTVSNYLAMLRDDPDDEASFQGLKEALSSGDPERIGEQPIRWLEMARAGHESRGEHRAAAWLIEAEALILDDDPDFKHALFKELGRIRHEELLDDAGAIDAYRAALALRKDDDIEEKIDQIGQLAENWQQIAERFQEEAEDASDANLKSSLLSRAGSLIWQYKKKSKAKQTDKLFKGALEADPADARAARLYMLTLAERERWSDAAKVLLTAAQSTGNRDDQLNLFVRAARVYHKRAEDGAKAAEAYEGALEIAPGHQEALGFLVEHYTTTESWDNLVRVYEAALKSPKDSDAEQGTLFQLAMVHWRFRNEPAAAEPYFGRLRKLNPSHPAMVSFYRDFLTGDDDADKLMTILSDAQRAAEGDQQKLELALDVARLTAKSSGSVEKGIDAWKTVQRLDASNEEATAALRDLYGRGEKWNAMVDVMKAEIDALPKDDPDAKARRLELLRELVVIYRDHLNLDVMVVNTYNAILEDDPGDAEALSNLASTYEQMGRWNDLIRVLAAQADAAEEPEQQIELNLRVATLWIDRFANYNQATKPLEKVIALQPGNRDALRQLKEIYSKKRAWKQLYEVLLKESELISDPDARLAQKIELAKLAGDRLRKHADAIVMWLDVIEEAPDTPGALESLEKLSDRERDFPTLAKVLELKVERVTDDKGRVKILQKLGLIYGDHLEDHSKAAGAWKRVLEIDPKNGRAKRTLRESFLQARDWEGLESLYRERDELRGAGRCARPGRRAHGRRRAQEGAELPRGARVRGGDRRAAPGVPQLRARPVGRSQQRAGRPGARADLREGREVAAPGAAPGGAPRRATRGRPGRGPARAHRPDAVSVDREAQRRGRRLQVGLRGLRARPPPTAPSGRTSKTRPAARRPSTS